MRGQTQGVFVADIAAKKVRFVPVTVGVEEGDLAQVLKPAGLAGYVVTVGQHLLEDGSTITIPGLEAAASASRPARADGPREQIEANS